MRNSFLFTSESVSEGHPDKVADQISDSIVDLFLSKDPEARVACETLVTTQRIVLAGEVRATQPGNTKEENEAFTQGIIDSLEPLVRAAVKDIGYEQSGFHWNEFRFENNLHGQSAHIAQGVDAKPSGRSSMPAIASRAPDSSLSRSSARFIATKPPCKGAPKIRWANSDEAKISIASCQWRGMRGFWGKS